MPNYIEPGPANAVPGSLAEDSVTWMSAPDAPSFNVAVYGPDAYVAGCTECDAWAAAGLTVTAAGLMEFLHGHQCPEQGR
jgi:hypothetical protein